MKTLPFRYVHLCLAGFTQRYCRHGNGVHALFERLYQRYAGPQTLVEYFPWYVDPGRIAGCLAELNDTSLSETGQPVAVQVAGYSFGGQTAAHVADKLVGTGARIDEMVLCDPVCRRGRLGWLAAANPLAMIYVPDTVRRLRVLSQSRPRWQLAWPPFMPAGHRVLSHGHVQREPDHDLTDSATHLTIDNHGDFHELVLDAAERLHERPPAVPMRAPADRDLAGGDYLKDAA